MSEDSAAPTAKDASSSSTYPVDATAAFAYDENDNDDEDDVGQDELPVISNVVAGPAAAAAAAGVGGRHQPPLPPPPQPMDVDDEDTNLSSSNIQPQQQQAGASGQSASPQVGLGPSGVKARRSGFFVRSDSTLCLGCPPPDPFSTPMQEALPLADQVG